MVRVLAIALVAVLAFAAAASLLRDRASMPAARSEAPRAPEAGRAVEPLVVEVGEFDVTVGGPQRARWQRLNAFERRRAIRRWSGDTHQGRVSFRVDWNASDLQRVEEAVMGDTGRVAVGSRVASVVLHVPRIRQAMRNNCETASLAMMLRGTQRQEALQRLLPRAKPLTLRTNPAGGRVWGDPQVGFVGNVRGGGYGVYDQPLLRLARRFDAGAENLTGRPFAEVVAAVVAGRPVILWLARGASRPMTWTTPAGKQVRADAAEHAVLLIAWSRDGDLAYNDPLDGRRYEVSARTVERRWRLLGGRAIAGSPLTNPALVPPA